MQAVRVVDTAVLDVPMEKVTGVIRAPGGIVGTGALFAINNNADNQLATLRYRLKDADMQAVEEPFEAAGRRFNRGTFLVRERARRQRSMPTTKDLGLKAYGLASAPASKTHPVRAARVAIIHTWTSTQTEGWWRIAFDQLHIPYDYISPQDIARTPDLKSRWDVLIFPPGGGNALGADRGHADVGRDPVPWKVSPDTPNLGTIAQTDDIRPGLTWQGLITLQNFVESRVASFVAATNSTELPLSYGLTRGVVDEPDSGQHDGQGIRCCARGLSTRPARSRTAWPTTSPSSATTARASASTSRAVDAVRGRAVRGSAAGAHDRHGTARTIRK